MRRVKRILKLMGMVSPSEIRVARVGLPALEKLAQTKAANVPQRLQQID